MGEHGGHLTGSGAPPRQFIGGHSMGMPGGGAVFGGGGFHTGQHGGHLNGMAGGGTAPYPFIGGHPMGMPGDRYPCRFRRSNGGREQHGQGLFALTVTRSHSGTAVLTVDPPTPRGGLAAEGGIPRCWSSHARWRAHSGLPCPPRHTGAAPPGGRRSGPHTMAQSPGVHLAPALEALQPPRPGEHAVLAD